MEKTSETTTYFFFWGGWGGVRGGEGYKRDRYAWKSFKPWLQIL